MRLRNLIIVIFSAALVSCGGKGGNSDKVDINSLIAESAAGNNLEISAESMNAIIESIPSPLEIAMVIKQSGIDFRQDLLNSSDNASKYITDQEKALSIGIYGGDLGYINIFEKAFLTVNYINVIKRQADAINVGHFFDYNTIKRMASNNDKMDSLIYLSTLNFNRMDEYLRGQKRSNLSILMVTGTWTEGLYIATQVVKNNNNKDIMEWVGYQKIIVDQLLLGLSAYKNDEFFQKITGEMNQLKAVYNNVAILYEYHEPESVEIDGRLVIVDKSTSTVNITPEQVAEIGNIVARMRNTLTGSK
jgi:hypothetical protein